MQSLEEPSLTDLVSWLWRQGDLSYKLWPQQISIYNSIRSLDKNISTVVMLLARQFGKSHLGVILAIEDCIRYPGKCILIVGPTLKQTREIVTPRMNDIRRDSPAGLIRPSKSEGKWYIGDSELVIGGFDINSSSQRGKTVQNIYIEEIVESQPDDFVESMRSDLGPALTHSNGGRMVFLTTLPKVPDHPFIIETMTQAEMDGSLYVFTIDDNLKLSPEQKARCIKLAGGIHTVDYKREYLCQIVRDASVVVVPDYDDAAHSDPHLIFPLKFFPQITTDFGGVRDKTVALFHFYDFFNDQTIVWDERVFEPNTETGIIVQGIRDMEALWMTDCANFLPLDESGELVQIARYVDAPGQLQVDLNAHHKISMSIVPKADWQTAINNVAVRFSQDKVRVHARCAFLRQTLKSGTFNKQRNDFARTNALGHCDAIAALMYGLRVERRQNPYGKNFTSRDTTFVIEHKKETPLAEIIQPKVFSNNFQGTFVPRKFGSFKK